MKSSSLSAVTGNIISLISFHVLSELTLVPLPTMSRCVDSVDKLTYLNHVSSISTVYYSWHWVCLYSENTPCITCSFNIGVEVLRNENSLNFNSRKQMSSVWNVCSWEQQCRGVKSQWLKWLIIMNICSKPYYEYVTLHFLLERGTHGK